MVYAVISYYDGYFYDWAVYVSEERNCKAVHTSHSDYIRPYFLLAADICAGERIFRNSFRTDFVVIADIVIGSNNMDSYFKVSENLIAIRDALIQ